MKNYTHGRPGVHHGVVLSDDEPARLLAFDAHVDKLYRRREEEAEDGERAGEEEEVVHDPLADPALPMPPGLRERIEGDERRWRKERASLPGKLKIRQARPGQSPPGRDGVGTGVGHRPTKKKSA